jgi:precorrin-6A/cobalt-precorrin-6A reductase
MGRAVIQSKRLLLLGGTSDAVELAGRAAALPNVEVITSLAGRTRQPIVTQQNTRIGGFGGVAGLIGYLKDQQIDCLIDATHPFAAQISFHAAAAAIAVNIPHLIFLRPAWSQTNGDRWIEVDSNATAAKLLPEMAQRIFLTIGRQELAAFADLKEQYFLMRMIDPPLLDAPVPPGKILLDRGPFTLKNERSLLQEYDIGAIVSKNSGGDATYAKIIAARELKIPVVMVQRPPMPVAEQVSDIESALSWLRKNP